MNNKEIRIELTSYMWHIGRILTDFMIISDNTKSPIIIQTFQAANNLFDTLGKCVYGNLPLKKIFPELNLFIKSLDFDSDSDFDSLLEYAHRFSQDFLSFLEEQKLKE